MLRSALVCFALALIVACGGSSDETGPGATATEQAEPTSVEPTSAPVAATLAATMTPVPPRATAVPPTSSPEATATVIANSLFTPTTYAEPPAQPPYNSSLAGTAQRDVTYCVAEGIELKMDVYFPRRRAPGTAPVVLYIHGGRLMSGDKRNIIGPTSSVNGPAYTAAGYVVASLNYRLAPDARLPDMIEDVKCAIRHLRARAGSYNIDPDHIGVIGTSSGAYLAALLGVADASAGFEGAGAFDGVSSRVQAVVLDFPHVDYTQPGFSAAEQESNDNALPVDAGQEFLVAMTAITHISPDDPPFSIYHGDADHVLSAARSEDMHKRLSGAGVTSSFTLVLNGGHGWQDDAPRKPGVTGPISPTRDDINAQQIAFFDEYLK
jgi:acetyl esterase/lipase